MKQDVHTIYVIIVATLALGMLTAVLIIGALMVARHLRKKNLEHLQRLQEEGERTLEVVSREIHDNIGQSLSTGLLLLPILKKKRAPALLDQLQAILERALADTKDMSHSLNPVYLQRQRLLSVIEEKVGWVNATRKINCGLCVNGQLVNMDSNRELLIFRIVQEALANSIKHANADKIVIQLDYHAEDLWLTIMDNGKGFDRDHPDFKEGLGMNSMQQRSLLLQGKLEIKAYPNEGVQVGLWVPLEECKSRKFWSQLFNFF